MMIALLVGLVSCSEEKPKRGMKYMPDMYDSPAYQSQSVLERTSAEDRTVHHIPMLLTPPDGTMARDAGLDLSSGLDPASVKNLANPLLPDAATLKLGQRWFNITCAVCHGRDGNAANGYVAPTPKRPQRFTGIPSLNGPNVERFSDGELFLIISVGRARMPSLHSQLPTATRWAVIHYLRALDRAWLSLADAEAQLKRMESTLAAGGAAAATITSGDLDLQRRLTAQRQRDLALIQSGGDGAAFAPPQAPRPEYEATIRTAP
jgi:mono/diheme cytochrome c family protein